LLSLLAGALVSQALVWALAPVLGGPWAIPALVLYGIGAGVAPACLFLLPHFIEGGRASAANFGILMVGRNLGSFVGPVLLPLLVDLRTLPPYELEWFLLVTTGAIAMTGILARLRRQGMSR